MTSPFDQEIPTTPVDEIGGPNDPLPTDANHPNQTGIGQQTFIAKGAESGKVYDTFQSNPEEQKPIQKKHHNIVDMYWLINQKLFNKEKLGDGEAGVFVVGYNADFNNLRLGFYKINGGSFTKSSMVKDKMIFLTSLNLFSETCYNIIDCLRTNKDIKISNFERIIGVDNKWIPNQTKIVGNSQAITIQTLTPEEKYFHYTLQDWQIAAFASALRYMTEGNSWNQYLGVRSK